MRSSRKNGPPPALAPTNGGGEGDHVKKHRYERILHSLESGWNDHLYNPHCNSLNWKKISVNKDLKRLIYQNKLPNLTEIKLLPTRTLPTSLSNTSSSTSHLQTSDNELTAYDSIITTLGFTHHQGSDKMIELKILKLILKRENILNLLTELCHLSSSSSSSSYPSSYPSSSYSSSFLSPEIITDSISPNATGTGTSSDDTTQEYLQQ